SQAVVIIKDTPGVSVSKKKTPAKGKRSKDILSDATLTKAAQLKEATKQSKKDFHISHVSGSDEGTGTKPGVPDVPKYDSESKKESWGGSGEEEDDKDDTKDDNDNDGNDDDGDNDSNDDDGNNDGNDDDGDNDDNDDDSDDKRTKSDRDENPNLNQSNEEHDK
ncbi:hypothetical protein Tco_0722051, partial [Tanacetum coccineum]